MRYERVADVTLPKIGFGTWRIGGESTPKPSIEAQSLAALRSALELGYTHFDTSEHYAAGYTEELLGRAIRDSNTERARLCLTSKVWPNHLRYEDVVHSCEGSLRRLDTDYLDLYLIHWPNDEVPLKETFRALNQLVKEGKVRHIGVSNFTLRLLKQARGLAESPLLTNQVPYSIYDRTYVKNGVLAYCQENDILLTAYSPVEAGRLRPNSAVQAIAGQRGLTLYQVALAWLVSQARVIAIPMSSDPAHQAENLAAADIELSPAEFEELSRQ